MTDTTNAGAQDTTDATATKAEEGAATEVAANPTGQDQQENAAGGEAEAKAVEGETKDAGSGEAEPEKPAGAPEQYEDFTTPEGVELDPEVLTSFKDQAKALNLDQSQAQSVVDLGVKLQQSWADQANAAIDQTIAGWEEAAKTDAEIGGEAFEKSLANAKSVTDRFGSEAFRTELLEKFKMGSHPEFIRFCNTIANAVSEDGMVSATGEAKQPREFGAGWFDHPTSKMS